MIGRICKDVPAAKAADVIFGYTLANDVSARDLQQRDGQWSRAKGFDSFCRSAVDRHRARPRCHRLGHRPQDVRRRGPASGRHHVGLIFDIPRIIEHVSAAMTLLPGDVILTGTPAGVGPLQPGEEVEITSSFLGALTNPVIAKQ